VFKLTEHPEILFCEHEVLLHSLASKVRAHKQHLTNSKQPVVTQAKGLLNLCALIVKGREH